MRIGASSLLTFAAVVLSAAGQDRPETASQEATLVPGQELFIEIPGECTFGRIIGIDGKIVLPLLGKVQAAGLTTAQVARVVRERLQGVQRISSLHVTMVDERNRYYVDGNVAHPGVYPTTGNVSLMDALVAAGGLTRAANSRRITVMHDQLVLRVNYRELLKGRHMDLNILLQSGDHVIVR